MLTFGIEEEFMLLDGDSLRPVSCAEFVRRRLATEPDIRPTVNREFLASQIEYSSPVFTRLDQAESHLLRFRRLLGEAAAEVGVLPAGVGLPFDTEDDPRVTDRERYRRIGEDIRRMTDDHQMNALHIHVAIPDPDAGVRALNGLRGWLPLLLAMGANSPFWRGRDSGFASWRSLVQRRWVITGAPPVFRDADDYDRRTSALVDSGAAADLAIIAWAARLSAHHPTLELRVFDAQLDAEDALFLAAVSRALVATVLGDPRPAIPPAELLDAAMWNAAREGSAGTVLDPRAGRSTPFPTALMDLVRYIGPAATETSDTALISDGVARLLADGDGASRQRAAFADGGRAALCDLLSANSPVAR